jgi:hypothetical protein
MGALKTRLDASRRNRPRLRGHMTAIACSSIASKILEEGIRNIDATILIEGTKLSAAIASDQWISNLATRVARCNNDAQHEHEKGRQRIGARRYATTHGNS